MSRLPEVRMVPAPQRQRVALWRWLQERIVDLALREERGERTAKPRVTTPFVGAVEESEPLERGQIRLLRPLAGPGEDRPRYVLVLDEARDGYRLVVPFGPYAGPAVPGEMITRLRAPALRVLCVWNAFVVRAGLLERGWVVGRMNESAMTGVRELHSSLIDGSDLPTRLAGRVGPPLVHPGDPRVDYLEEERKWVPALAGERVMRMAVFESRRTSELPGQRGDLAADRRGRYRSSRERRRKGSRP